MDITPRASSLVRPFSQYHDSTTPPLSPTSSTSSGMISPVHGSARHSSQSRSKLAAAARYVGSSTWLVALLSAAVTFILCNLHLFDFRHPMHTPWHRPPLHDLHALIDDAAAATNSIAVIPVNLTTVIDLTTTTTNTDAPDHPSYNRCCPVHKRGFWPAARTLYLNHDMQCQLDPLVLQIYDSQCEDESNQCDRTIQYWNNQADRLTPETLAVALGDPSNAYPPEWTTDTWIAWLNTKTDLTWMSGKVFIIIGDSLDAFGHYGLCGQMSPATKSQVDVVDPEYATSHYVRPNVCHSHHLNFTILFFHHFGVMSSVYPPEKIANPYNTSNVVNVQIDRAMKAINRTLANIALIQFYSGLWDINAKGAAFQMTPAIIQHQWVPMLKSELFDPVIALADSLPVRPMLVVRTMPPNKYGDEQNELIYQMNEAMYNLLDNYKGKERVHLIDVASMLATRQQWAFDGHHMPPVTFLQIWNVVLNMYHQFEVLKNPACGWL